MGGRPRQERPGGRAQDRLARLRRPRRRAPERLRRLRQPRAPRRPRRARVTKVKRSHAEAVAVELVEPGAPRVEAPCAHYPTCGGCRFQDLAYEAQLDAKAQQVADALAADRRLRRPRARSPPCRPGRYSTTGTSSSTPSRPSPTAGSASASTAPGRWDEVLDVERCWLTTDLGNGIREAVKAWARAEGLPAYDQEKQEGYLRHLVVREGRNTGQALVVLVTAPGDLAGADGLVEALQAFPEVRSIHWAVNDSPGRGDQPPDRPALGRRGDRGGARSASATACARTPSCRRTRRCARCSTGSWASTRS